MIFHSENRFPFSGFTLVEFLVVCVSLAVLSLTLVPVLSRSTNSKTLQCLNNHRQLCAAWQMYSEDSHDQIVFASDDGTGDSNFLNQYAWTWSHMDFSQNPGNWDTNVDMVLRPLWPYAGKNPSLFKCPSDTSSIVVGYASKPRTRSVSMNVYLGGWAGTTGGWSIMAPYQLYLKRSEVAAPAKIFVFLDVRADAIIWGDFLVDMTGYPASPSQYVLRGFPGLYHERGCTFSFADGRVEVKRWFDSRTTPPPLPAGSLWSDSVPSPRNADMSWLQDHATRPK